MTLFPKLKDLKGLISHSAIYAVGKEFLLKRILRMLLQGASGSSR